MKKILSAVLVLAMLLGFTAFPVAADETAATIHAGEVKGFDLLTREGREFRFAPAESGKYILYMPIGSDFDCSVHVCADNGDLKPVDLVWWYDPAGEYEGFVIDAQLGQNYAFLIYNSTLKVINCSVGLEKAQAFETFELNCTQYSGYADDILNLSIHTAPQLAYETITWSSSNPNVAEIWDAINGEAKIRLMAPGTTVVSATSESGKSATCRVTVKEKPAIDVGQTVNVTVGHEEQEQLLFTPEESGRYIIYMPQKAMLNLSVTESETHTNVERLEAWDSDDGKSSGEIYELEAGASYLINLYNLNYSYKISTTVTLEKVQNYDFFAFDFSEIVHYVGDEMILQVQTGPAAAIETISWTSSDSNVAFFEFSSGSMAWFGLKKAGTCTITATSSSGKTASCVVHVVEPEKLILDEVVTFSLKPSEYVLYQFTAPADGVYSVYGAADTISCDIYAEDASGEWIQPVAQWVRDGISGFDFVMDAGETYVFQFSHSSEAEAQFDAMVSRRAVRMGDTDGNGKIQTNDAKLVLQHIVKMPVELNLDAADVDGNGKIQTNDAKLILQYIVKIIDKFPAENEQSSDSWGESQTPPAIRG